MLGGEDSLENVSVKTGVSLDGRRPGTQGAFCV